MGKKPTLAILLVLLASGLVMSDSVLAQSIPQPSTPKFTVNYVDFSYDVSPTTTSTIDPYNGKNIITDIPGYHVKDQKIQLTIKNQAYSSNINGNKSTLYFNVRMKGHFEQNWTTLYSCSPTSAGSLIIQSNSGDTALTFPASYRVNDEIDFSVQAILGYEYSYETNFYGQTVHIMPLQVNTFNYQSSSWSPTQTFVMPDTSTPTLTPNESGNQTSSDLNTVEIAILILIIIPSLIAALILTIRRRQKQCYNQLLL